MKFDSFVACGVMKAAGFTNPEKCDSSIVLVGEEYLEPGGQRLGFVFASLAHIFMGCLVANTFSGDILRSSEGDLLRRPGGPRIFFIAGGSLLFSSFVILMAAVGLSIISCSSDLLVAVCLT